MNRKTLAIVAIAAVLGVLLFFFLKKPATSEESGADAPKASATPVAGLGNVRPTIQSLPKASVAGLVSDQDGSAVPGARVCANASSPGLAGEDTRDLNCVLAGVDGRYTFASLIPARYTIAASARGFIPATYEYKKGEDTKSSFPLAASEDRSEINIVLNKGGVEVKGIVNDIGGGPVAGAWVSLSEGWMFSFGFGDTNRTGAVTVSEEDGSFSAWVEEGSIQASARAEGYADGSKSGVAPGQFIEIVMTPESVLAGRVVEASTGKPVAEVRVMADSDSWSDSEGSARTDANGEFRITRLSPGRYKPSAEMKGAYGVAAESVSLGLGQTREDIEIRVHPAFVVSGQVVVEGTESPCKESSISLTGEVGRGSEWAEYDEDLGLVELKAVLPGTYKVSAFCEGYVSQDEYPDIVVTDADRRGLQWTVTSGERVRGRVTNSAGEGVEDAYVGASVVGGDPRAQRTGGRDQTEEDGRFEIEGILPGEYSISAGAVGYIDAKEPTTVVVEKGQVPEVAIVLRDGGSLSGVVVNEDGEAIKGASIRASSLSGGRRSGGWGQALDDGTFTIKSLEAGRYRVSASMGGWRGQALRAKGKSDDDVHGVETKIAVGKNSEVRLVVQSTKGTITGTVLDEQGKPVSDAFIDSQRQSEAAGASKSRARRSLRWGSWDSQLVLTDMEGRFTLEGLADGTYALRAHRKGGGEAIVEDVSIGSDATLTIRSTGSLAGLVRMTGGGFPVEFSVSVRDVESGFSREEEFYRTEGRWALRDLPAGTYAVQTSAAEGTAEVKDIALAESEAKAGIDLSLEARATVTGQLVTLEEGEPVPGMRVGVSPLAGGGYSFLSRGNKENISDEEGRFRVEDAPAGRVTVRSFPLDWSNSDFGPMRFIAQVEAGKDNDIGVLRLPKKRLDRRGRAGDLGFTLHEREAGTEPEDVVSKVALVRPGGPAADSGLVAGDIITQVDGHDVRGANSYLYWSLAGVKVGVTVAFQLERGETVKIKAGPPR